MASPGPSPVNELTAAEARELDALLGKLLLPSFTPREVEIASATARAVLPAPEAPETPR